MRLSLAIKQFTEWRALKVGQNTNQGYELVLKQFCLFMKNCEIEDVQLSHIVEWFSMMQELGWDSNSFVIKSTALRKFFEFNKKQGFEVLDPWFIFTPKAKFKIPRIITEENYQKLLSAIPDNNDPRHIRNKAIISLLWDTGARNGEIVSLDIQGLDLVNFKALIYTEKSKGARPVREMFWTEETNKNLLRWIDRREHLSQKMKWIDPEALFVCVSFHAGERLTIKGVGEMLRRYSNQAGIETMNAHSFRHHLGREIIKRGGTNADVMNVLGHATLESTKPYTWLENKEIEKRYRSLKLST
ncbi:MAG: tyrosine-type recombinase/integrase [Patescibacteria group bacterium]